MSHSPSDPHLNFLNLRELEKQRKHIKEGEKFVVSPEIFAQAEEAYGAVRSMQAPRFISRLAKMSLLSWYVLLAMVLFGMALTLMKEF